MRDARDEPVRGHPVGAVEHAGEVAPAAALHRLQRAPRAPVLIAVVGGLIGVDRARRRAAGAARSGSSPAAGRRSGPRRAEWRRNGPRPSSGAPATTGGAGSGGGRNGSRSARTTPLGSRTRTVPALDAEATAGSGPRSARTRATTGHRSTPAMLRSRARAGRRSPCTGHHATRTRLLTSRCSCSSRSQPAAAAEVTTRARTRPSCCSDTFGRKQPVQSGNLDLGVSVDAAGVAGLPSPLRIGLKGPFDSSDRAKPKFDFDLSARHARRRACTLGRDLDGRQELADDRRPRVHASGVRVREPHEGRSGDRRTAGRPLDVRRRSRAAGCATFTRSEPRTSTASASSTCAATSTRSR